MRGEIDNVHIGRHDHALETLGLSTAEEFETSLDCAKEWATSVGYAEEDVDDIIKSARRINGNKNRG